jgi:hypothetical protein
MIILGFETRNGLFLPHRPWRDGAVARLLHFSLSLSRLMFLSAEMLYRKVRYWNTDGTLLLLFHSIFININVLGRPYFGLAPLPEYCLARAPFPLRSVASCPHGFVSMQMPKLLQTVINTMNGVECMGVSIIVLLYAQLIVEFVRSNEKGKEEIYLYCFLTHRFNSLFCFYCFTTNIFTYVQEPTWHELYVQYCQNCLETIHERQSLFARLGHAAGSGVANGPIGHSVYQSTPCRDRRCNPENVAFRSMEVWRLAFAALWWQNNYKEPKVVDVIRRG